ncbi:MAG: hypothetical protein C4567_02005 [Deltaproteobacteria bacterium]|nr:MAG: hypothetical protein C4567_02005 [Deltaproteobacteria bacterium]
MCTPRVTQHPGPVCGCDCGCGLSFRKFFSAPEELECLENYREQLKKELAGVEEHLGKLQGK